VLGREDFNLFVRPLLFDFIAKGDNDGGLGPVYLILLLTEEERAWYSLTADMKLELKPPDAFIELCCEFFEYKYFEDRRSKLPEGVKKVIQWEWELDERKARWSPSQLVSYYAEKKKKFSWT
jgi:hypothetical protein